MTVPTLIVQGVSDPFGMPPAAAGRTVVQVPGDHGLKKDLPAVAAAVQGWLPGIVAQPALGNEDALAGEGGVARRVGVPVRAAVMHLELTDLPYGPPRFGHRARHQRVDGGRDGAC